VIRLSLRLSHICVSEFVLIVVSLLIGTLLLILFWVRYVKVISGYFSCKFLLSLKWFIVNTILVTFLNSASVDMYFLYFSKGTWFS
jgi:hypothetical protein